MGVDARLETCRPVTGQRTACHKFNRRPDWLRARKHTVRENLIATWSVQASDSTELKVEPSAWPARAVGQRRPSMNGAPSIPVCLPRSLCCPSRRHLFHCEHPVFSSSPTSQRNRFGRQFPLKRRSWRMASHSAEATSNCHTGWCV